MSVFVLFGKSFIQNITIGKKSVGLFQNIDEFIVSRVQHVLTVFYEEKTQCFSNRLRL